MIALLYWFYLCVVKQEINIHVKIQLKKIIQILVLSQFKLKLLLSLFSNQTLVRTKKAFICHFLLCINITLYYIDLNVTLTRYLEYHSGLVYLIFALKVGLISKALPARLHMYDMCGIEDTNF